ncbi:MAG: DUF3047 domain-containing protein [Thauera sp.]|nr:DUF3047 domain-containing protein [Thauera sp.]
MPASRCVRRAIALSLIFTASMGHAATVWVGRFPAGAEGLPEPWRLQQIDERIAPTQYALKTWDGVAAVEAVAERSMALLGRPLDVDLAATPHLCWLWRVDAPLATADMTTKAGDDYAARVYVSFKVEPGALGFGTRAKLALARSIYGDQVPDAALNYVWDNRQPVGTFMPNAYTDRTRMIVLRSGAGDAGSWVTERRDVAEDFKRAFGEVPAQLSGIALASDTDNTGESARAGFAEFRFVSRDEACVGPD